MLNGPGRQWALVINAFAAGSIMPGPAFPFFIPHRTIAGSEIAKIAGSTSPRVDFAISAVASLESACATDLCYMDNRKYLGVLKSTKARACLVSPRFSAASAQMRPNPLDVPVMNQTFDPCGMRLHSLLVVAARAIFPILSA